MSTYTREENDAIQAAMFKLIDRLTPSANDRIITRKLKQLTKLWAVKLN